MMRREQNEELCRLLYDYLREDDLYMEYWTDKRSFNPVERYKEIETCAILYGNVNQPYEDWYNESGSKLCSQWSFENEPVTDAIPYIKRQIIALWEQFKSEKGRDPLPDELAEWMADTLTPNRQFPEIILKIHCDTDIDKILRPLVQKKIQKVRKDFEIPRGQKILRFAPGHLRVENLKAYLEVYRIQNKYPNKTRREIVTEYGKDLSLNEDVMVSRYTRKAKNIIYNLRFLRPFDTSTQET